MGRPHLYNTSPMFEGEPNQNWNHMYTEQRYTDHGRTSTSVNGSFVYPVENMSTSSISFPPHWNSGTRSNGYASSSRNIEAPPHHSDTSGTSHNRFLHSSTAGTCFAMPGNYLPQPSNPNFHRQSFPVVNGGLIDLTMASGQGTHKRKSLGVPSVYERGSTSRNVSIGSASDFPSSSELQPEKPNMASLYMPGDYVSGISIRGEDSLRNVRRRSAFDLESNLSRTPLLSNHRHNSYSTGLQIDQFTPLNHSSQTSSTLTRDWNQMSMYPAHGRVLSSVSSSFNHETSHFLVGSGSTNASVGVRGFTNDFGTSRNPMAPQSFHFHNNLTQTTRGLHSNFSQRPTTAFRASSSLRFGYVAPSDDGLHMMPESYSTRHPRPLTSVGWHSGDRNGRSRMYGDRYRSLTNEGFMIVDHASLYGSRNIHDQHRDMRMEIDNMSYEELLALGERIGHVSTGLSEDMISKYLTEKRYCSAEQSEEGTCVICLEEYKNMDNIGTLKTCKHDYHVSCIRKWLSVKNVCPICKAEASALPDRVKDK